MQVGDRQTDIDRSIASKIDDWILHACISYALYVCINTCVNAYIHTHIARGVSGCYQLQVISMNSLQRGVTDQPSSGKIVHDKSALDTKKKKRAGSVRRGIEWAGSVYQALSGRIGIGEQKWHHFFSQTSAWNPVHQCIRQNWFSHWHYQWIHMHEGVEGPGKIQIRPTVIVFLGPFWITPCPHYLQITLCLLHNPSWWNPIKNDYSICMVKHSWSVVAMAKSYQALYNLHDYAWLTLWTIIKHCQNFLK